MLPKQHLLSSQPNVSNDSPDLLHRHLYYDFNYIGHCYQYANADTLAPNCYYNKHNYQHSSGHGDFSACANTSLNYSYFDDRHDRNLYALSCRYNKYTDLQFRSLYDHHIKRCRNYLDFH